MEEKLDYGGFASVVTNDFDPTIYSEGITVASSFIAEAYLAFGFLGVVLSAFFHVIFTQFLLKLNVKDSFMHFVFVFVMAQWFFNSVRNDLIGWLIIGVIYVSVYIVIIHFYRGCLNLLKTTVK